jgi:hypothetical protein
LAMFAAIRVVAVLGQPLETARLVILQPAAILKATALT